MSNIHTLDSSAIAAANPPLRITKTSYFDGANKPSACALCHRIFKGRDALEGHAEHQFHEECLEKWFEQKGIANLKNSCPSCIEISPNHHNTPKPRRGAILRQSVTTQTLSVILLGRPQYHIQRESLIAMDRKPATEIESRSAPTSSTFCGKPGKPKYCKKIV